MTIINDEFVTLSCGYTIRTGSIVALCTVTGYVLVEGIGHILMEEPAEILRLHAHWIAVTSSRMGIHHSPAETNTKESIHDNI